MKKILIVVFAVIAIVFLAAYGTYTVMKSNAGQPKPVEIKAITTAAKKFEVCGVNKCYQTDIIQLDKNLPSCLVVDGNNEICGSFEIHQNL